MESIYQIYKNLQNKINESEDINYLHEFDEDEMSEQSGDYDDIAADLVDNDFEEVPDEGDDE